MTRATSIKHSVWLMLMGLTVSLNLFFTVASVITAFVVEDEIIKSLLVHKSSRLPLSKHAITGEASKNKDIFTYYDTLASVPSWARESIDPTRNFGELFTADKTHYHYQKITHNEVEGYLLAEVSSLLVVSNQPKLFLLIAIGVIVTLIISVFLATVLSNRITRPIVTLAKSLELPYSTDPLASLQKLPNEIGFLAKTFQQAMDKLHIALEREKAFANNVSHELRTPLQIAKNTCNLIGKRGFQNNDAATLETTYQQIESIVQTLLALARSRDLPKRLCPLKMHTEQALLNSHAVTSSKWRIHLDIPEEYTLSAHPQLLDILLHNIIKNAIEHASQHTLNIGLRQNELWFSNSIDAPPQLNLAAQGARSDTSSGIGQGLYLVTQIADAEQWQLNLETHPNQFIVKVQFC